MISLRNYVLFSVINSEFELLTCSNHNICFETLQLGIVNARYKYLPWHFWWELTKYMYDGIHIELVTCNISWRNGTIIYRFKKASIKHCTLQINRSTKQMNPPKKSVFYLLLPLPQKSWYYYLCILYHISNPSLQQCFFRLNKFLIFLIWSTDLHHCYFLFQYLNEIWFIISYLYYNF